MSQIAGLVDFREHGPPADIGTFQVAATAMVFRFTFSGTTYTCAIAGGASGWELIAYRPSGADDVEIQAAIDYVAALGGGKVVFGKGLYYLTATLLILVNDITLEGNQYVYIYLANNADVDALHIGDATHSARSTIIRNLKFYGNKANQGVAVNGIVFNGAVSVNNSLLQKIDIIQFKGSGIIAGNASANIWEDIYVEDNDIYGIDASLPPASTTINRFYVFTNGSSGIYGRFERGNLLNGYLNGNGVRGIDLANSDHTHMENLHIWNSVDAGMSLVESDHCNIINCNIFENDKNGILLAGAQYITIVGNKVYNNSQQTNNNWDGIRLIVSGAVYCIYNIISHNVFLSDKANKHRYDIYEADANQDYNQYKDNIMIGAVTAVVRLLGAHNKFATVNGSFPLSNVGGGAVAVAPVINTSPGGIDIDAANEFAHVKVPLPTEVQQVVRIKIWAYSNVIEATNNMLLRIVAHGAGSSELWSTNPIDVPDHPSEEEGTIVQYDVIHWVIDVGDDAQIGTLAAQDLLELLAVYNAVVGADIATDALFVGYEIEYV